MKRFFTVALPIFIMIIMAFICVITYMLFTNKLPKLNFNKNETVAQVEQSEDTVILSKKELPNIGTYSTLNPMVTAIVKDFTQDNSISNAGTAYLDMDEGYKKLLNGEIDILFAIYPPDDILDMAKAIGMEIEAIPVAKEGFVFYVSSENSVDSLKISDIQKIYSGQITNWAELGGDNIEIKATQKTRNSLNQRAMNLLVMKNLEMMDSPKDVFSDARFGQIDDLIAGYDNSKEAIGYSYYYEANTIYDTDSDTKVDNTVKFLKINDVAPNYENIHDGTYELQTNYYLLKNKENNYENIKIFVDNVQSSRGKNAIKEAGYIDN